jgi:hypothetical protein
VFGTTAGVDSADRQAEQRAAEEMRVRRLRGEKPKLWDVCTGVSDRWSEAKTRTRRRGGGGEDSLSNWWLDIMVSVLLEPRAYRGVGTISFFGHRFLKLFSSLYQPPKSPTQTNQGQSLPVLLRRPLKRPTRVSFDGYGRSMRIIRAIRIWDWQLR